MGERVDNGFRETFHGTRNRNSVRSHGQNGDPSSQSLDINNNGMGCDLPIMVVSRNESTSASQEERFEKFPSPKGISSRETGSPCRQDNNDGNGCGRSPDHNKYNDFNKKITKEEMSETTKSENEDNKMYVRGIYSYWEERQGTSKAGTKRNEQDYIPKQQIGGGIEDEYNQSIEGVSFGCCPNKERIRIMQASLGELCRNGALDSTPWTEIPKKPCKLIFPDNNDRESEDQASMSQVQVGSEDDEMLGLRNDPSNSLMLVEMIACESDICRIASYIGLEIKAKAPLEDLIIYMERVKRYGFNHIIIIGELYCGMLFLDCYGRLFEWNHMEYLLLPLGDYLKKDFQLDPAVAWGTADGFVFEIRIRQAETNPFTLTCPSCEIIITLTREEAVLASGKYHLQKKQTDTEQDDEELMASLGLVEGDSRAGQGSQSKHVTMKDQETSPIVIEDDASENNDDERTPDASNRSANVQDNLENTPNENSGNDSQDSATNDGNNTTQTRPLRRSPRRSSRQSVTFGNNTREHNILQGLLQELSTPVRGESIENNEVAEDDSEASMPKALARLFQKA
ncbi:15898_t:CDS:2, partial [Funneliformis caledonium]